jgi:acyl-CoA-dependent ceramide synthase
MAYYDSSSNLYGAGPDDLYYVTFWIVLITGLRAAIMDYVLRPFGKWGGIRTNKSLTRFTEQGWLLLYASCFWTTGMYIMYNSKYWLNLKELWTDFPTTKIGGLTKWYYLVQFAFWLQQIFVIHIEDRRSDHWQMFIHHLFTSSLLIASYGIYQTRVGNAILCVMDIIEILFPVSFRYNRPVS